MNLIKTARVGGALPRQLSCEDRRKAVFIRAAGKGFGSSNDRKRVDEDIPVPGTSEAKARRIKVKGKQQRRPPGQGYMPPATKPIQGLKVEDMNTETEDSLTDKIEFEARLKALKASTENLPITSSSETSVFDSPNYDNPPPLAQTLFSRSKDADSTDLSDENFGPSQIGLAIASLALVGIFVVTSGGSDLGYATRQSSRGEQRIEISDEQIKDLKLQLEEEEKKLNLEPNNPEIVEAAAVLHARLGDYTDAIKLLEQLKGLKEGNVDVLRVLAETEAAAGRFDEAINQYREAWQAAQQSDIEILTGLIDTIVSKGNPAKAIDELKKLYTSMEDRTGKIEESKNFGPVELGLLEAKVYSSWKGHVPDALAKYDELIGNFPDDFRPPLGKALLLRQQGREGDAQRYFIQAKYLAPKASRGTIDAFAANDSN